MLEMLRIINERNLLLGYRMMEIEDAEIMARVWIDAFDMAGIPVECYRAVYGHTILSRADSVYSGKQPPPLSAEEMITVWRRNMESIKQAAGIKKPEPTRRRDCERCYGSGVEVVEGRGARTCTNCRKTDVKTDRVR